MKKKMVFVVLSLVFVMIVSFVLPFDLYAQEDDSKCKDFNWAGCGGGAACIGGGDLNFWECKIDCYEGGYAQCVQI